MLGFTICAWVLAILILPVYLMHGTSAEQGWFEWFVWSLTAVLTMVYLVVLRRVVQIDKSTYVITVRNGPKSEETALGQFQTLRLELKRSWPWFTHIATLIGEKEQTQILTALSETSLRKKAEPIAQWLGIPIASADATISD